MAGIYLHVPFCKSKCIYCGFYSTPLIQNKEAYLQTLHQEIDLRKNYLHGEPIHTIYFGGGTPSLLTIPEITEIIQHLTRTFDTSNVQEITFEGNPEQLDLAYCQELKNVGINRLSIGIQSFHDHILQFMGRKHSAKEAIRAIKNAQAAEFTNLSIDLIYGVAERTDEQWKEELQIAFSHNVQHLSCYALTTEENSILYKQIQSHKQIAPDEDQAARQYQILLQQLAHTPLRQYEISNFSVKGYESKHNSSYWNHTPYLGLGPAAHSFDGTNRHWNASLLATYIQDIQAGKDSNGKEMLSPSDLFNEAILLGLRTQKGLDITSLRERYGDMWVDMLLQYFQKSVPTNHYEQKENQLHLTETGLWVADGIAAGAFIVED